MSTFHEKLESDLAWRLDELNALKHLVPTSPSKGTIREQALLRALWAMLYAHFEGYCISAIAEFLDALEKSGTRRQDFREPLLKFSLEPDFRKLRKGDNTAEKHYEFFKVGLHFLLQQPITFEKDEKTGEFIIKGRSNLWPEVLTETLDSICLPHPVLDYNKTRIYLLVDRRNKIAHGRQILVADLPEYQKYEDAAVDVMHELAIGLMESQGAGAHLKPTTDFVI